MPIGEEGKHHSHLQEDKQESDVRGTEELVHGDHVLPVLGEVGVVVALSEVLNPDLTGDGPDCDQEKID